ncbi:hypothetical protein H4582DRAFT_1959647, partial [Lactarius indigo]
VAQRCVFAKRKRDFDLLKFSHSQGPLSPSWRQPPHRFHPRHLPRCPHHRPIRPPAARTASTSSTMCRCLMRTTAKTQHEKARTAMSRCVMFPIMVGTRAHYRVSPNPRVPPGASHPPNSVYPTLLVKDSPLPSLPLNQSIEAAPHQRDRDRDYDPPDILIVEYSSSLLPPPPRRSPRKTKK